MAMLMCAGALAVTPPAVGAAPVWEEVPFPADTEGRTLISAGGPTNVWAFGSGTPLQWNGARWVARPVPAGADYVGVRSVAAVDGTQAWASGYRLESGGDFAPWVGRWTGASWVTVDPAPLTAPHVRSADTYEVVATGPDNVWIAYLVSTQKFATKVSFLHFDGATWTEVRVANRSCTGSNVNIDLSEVDLRRGNPVVSVECYFDDFTGHALWEWTGTHWAVRGTFDEAQGHYLQAVASLRSGALVAQDNGDIVRRQVSGEWTPYTPQDFTIEGFELVADPVTGALLIGGHTLRQHGGVSVWGQGAWTTRIFASLRNVTSVSVDPTSGTRWAIGPGVEGDLEVWRRVPSGGGT